MWLQKKKTKTTTTHIRIMTPKVCGGVIVEWKRQTKNTWHCVTFGLSVTISASSNSDITSPKLAPTQTDVLTMFLIRLYGLKLCIHWEAICWAAYPHVTFTHGCFTHSPVHLTTSDAVSRAVTEHALTPWHCPSCSHHNMTATRWTSSTNATLRCYFTLAVYIGAYE